MGSGYDESKPLIKGLPPWGEAATNPVCQITQRNVGIDQNATAAPSLVTLDDFRKDGPGFGVYRPFLPRSVASHPEEVAKYVSNDP